MWRVKRALAQAQRALEAGDRHAAQGWAREALSELEALPASDLRDEALDLAGGLLAAAGDPAGLSFVRIEGSA